MEPKYLLRREGALVLDIVFVALIFTILAFVLDSVTETRIVAPGLIKSNVCQEKNIVTQERLNRLLPILNENQKHRQTICQTTHMLVSSFSTLNLMRAEQANGNSRNLYVSYFVDENGDQINLVSLDSLLYLFAPLVFAYLLATRGTTFGKQALGLFVGDSNRQPLGLTKALKREYLKLLPLVIFALYQIYLTVKYFDIDIDAQVETLGELEQTLQSTTFGSVFFIGAILILGMFWYAFGSFIMWKGQTYWDKWAGAFVFRREQREEE